MLPAYRDGDVIVVSPAAPVRRGDRVVVKTKKGEVMVKELKRQTAKQVELKSLNPAQAERTLAHRRRGLDRAHRLGEPVAGASRDCLRTLPQQQPAAHQIDHRQRVDDHAGPLPEAVVGHALEHVGREHRAE